MAIPTLPPNAPFEPAQRAWLNGYFAGIFSSLEGTTEVPAAPFANNSQGIPSNGIPSNGAPTNGAAPRDVGAPPEQASRPTETPAEDEDYPWHDPTMEMAERMELAQGRPLVQRLMAAMAQQDCGQCGYLCDSYAAVIASGEEKSLTKCVPGGKETSKKLKELMAAG